MPGGRAFDAHRIRDVARHHPHVAQVAVARGVAHHSGDLVTAPARLRDRLPPDPAPAPKITMFMAKHLSPGPGPVRPAGARTLSGAAVTAGIPVIVRP
ncbi:hypothetical protein GCM10027612_61140 [Microbispora bryophytorum subsp. camponoti]